MCFHGSRLNLGVICGKYIPLSDLKCKWTCVKSNCFSAFPINIKVFTLLVYHRIFRGRTVDLSRWLEGISEKSVVFPVLILILLLFCNWINECPPTWTIMLQKERTCIKPGTNTYTFSHPVRVRSTENCVPVYCRIIVTPGVTVPV